MLFLQGHGVTHNSDSILIAPDFSIKDEERAAFLNVTNICKIFAKVERCITIVFFDACRDPLTDYPNLLEENRKYNQGEGSWFTLETKN